MTDELINYRINKDKSVSVFEAGNKSVFTTTLKVFIDIYVKV